MIIYVERDELSRKMSFPLIARLYTTGEPLNPWRCDACLTKKQRAMIEKARAMQAACPGEHIVCRKCGVFR